MVKERQKTGILPKKVLTFGRCWVKEIENRHIPEKRKMTFGRF